MGDEIIEQGAAFSDDDPPPNTTTIQVVFYCVLTLLIGAVAYDVVVARRDWNAAIERLNVKIRGPQGGATVVPVDPITRDQVAELVGRPPVETTEGSNYYLECYRWQRAIPWKRYDLYVIFSKGTVPLLHDISYPGPPDASQFPR